MSIVLLLTIMLLVLLVVLIAVIISYAKATSSYNQLKAEKDKELESLQDQTEGIYAQAREDWYDLLKEGHDKAAEVVQSADLFSDSLKKKIEEELGKTTKREMGEYDATMESIKSEIVKVAQNISSDIKADLIKEVSEARAQVDKELEEYKKVRYEQIASQANEIIESVARQALGKSLSTQDHEQLVLKALETYSDDK